MRLGNRLQSHTQIPKRKNHVVNNTIKIQTPAVILNISQAAATLYAEYISQNNTPVAQLDMQDILMMKNVQGDSFNAHFYSGFLDERVHSMRYDV